MKKNINVDLYGIEIRDAAEKVGSLFGEKGREVGKTINNFTKNVWIKIPK